MPLEAWRQAHFGSPYNTGPGPDDADPEGDGPTNLVEYATATKPVVNSAPPKTGAINGTRVEYTSQQPVAAPGEVSYRFASRN